MNLSELYKQVEPSTNIEDRREEFWRHPQSVAAFFGMQPPSVILSDLAKAIRDGRFFDPPNQDDRYIRRPVHDPNPLGEAAGLGDIYIPPVSQSSNKSWLDSILGGNKRRF